MFHLGFSANQLGRCCVSVNHTHVISILCYQPCCSQGYWYAPGWRKYRAALPGLCNGPSSSSSSNRVKSADDGAAKAAGLNSAVAASANQVLPTLVLAYATVTGNTQQYADAIAGIFQRSGAVQVCVADTCMTTGSHVLQLYLGSFQLKIAAVQSDWQSWCGQQCDFSCRHCCSCCRCCC
jgi:hypothetical protein